MAATVAAAYAAIFRGSLHEIQALALGAISFVGLDQYVAPRDRAKIYLSASAQMACLAILANRTSFIIYSESDEGRKIHFSRTFLLAVKLLHAVKTQRERDSIRPIIDLPNTGVTMIASAMNTVDRSGSPIA
jgi:hypothetical protein